MDVVPPNHDIGAAEFVRADIRNPVIAKVIERAGVDTVVHMNVIATPTSAGGRVSMKEINVIGTMQLLAACQKASGVRRLVVKSTTSVYGASPRDPAQFTEDAGAKVLPRAGWGKDSVEVEGYVRGFSRRRPDVDVAVLRLANAVGPGMRTALTDYFELPAAPTVMGFDPRLQFVHEADLVEAMRLATVGSVTGIVNVAGDGVVTLLQALGMTGRPFVPVPSPVFEIVARGIRRAFGVDLSSELVRQLTYGRVVDTTRMRRDLGLEPRYTSREAFADHARARRLAGPVPEDVLDATQRQVLAMTRRLESGFRRVERDVGELVGAATGLGTVDGARPAPGNASGGVAGE